MKIAITSEEKNLNDQMAKTFGRCPYFLIVEISDKKIKKTEFIKNDNADQNSGAGVSSAQLMVDNNIEIVITGNVGPKAQDALKQFGIKINLDEGGSINDVLQGFIKSIK